MGISTGMKIGMASGFMARREKIEEQEKEQTDDFREATKAAKKRAQGILAKQKATREEDILTGQGLIQSQEVAPLMKNLKVNDDLLAAIGLEQKVLERQGFTAKEIAKDLSNKIVDIATRMDEQKQKKLQDAQRQEAEVEKSKNTPRNFANIVSEAFSGSARGEAARDLIKQSITPEEQKVIDSDFTTEERKASLGLTPERSMSASEKIKTIKFLSGEIAEQEENPTQKISVLEIIVNDDIDPYKSGTSNIILRDIKNIEEQGVEFNQENSKIIKEDILERGAKVVMDELKEGKHSLQSKKITGSEKLSKGSKEDKTDKDLSIEGLTKQGKPRPTKDGYIQTYVNEDKTKVFEVTLNKQFEVIDKVSK
jgi:hypothetical protein